MTERIDREVLDLAGRYVEELVEEIDPDEVKYPDQASLEPFVRELALVIDEAITAWQQLKREATT